MSLDKAKKVAAVALVEARKNNWFMAVSVVDPSGTLIYYEKMDDTQTGSANVSIEKAGTAALFKRTNKSFQDMVAGGVPAYEFLVSPATAASTTEFVRRQERMPWENSIRFRGLFGWRVSRGRG